MSGLISGGSTELTRLVLGVALVDLVSLVLLGVACGWVSGVGVGSGQQQQGEGGGQQQGDLGVGEQRRGGAGLDQLVGGPGALHALDQRPAGDGSGAPGGPRPLDGGGGLGVQHALDDLGGLGHVDGQQRLVVEASACS
jgi:hypothetical protein